jgi:hypothetical protein
MLICLSASLNFCQETIKPAAEVLVPLGGGLQQVWLPQLLLHYLEDWEQPLAMLGSARVVSSTHAVLI